MLKENSEYDALEKDLSHVNIFFGNDHCMGELSLDMGDPLFLLRSSCCLCKSKTGPRHEKGQGNLSDASLFSLWVKLLFINCDFVFCAAYSRELKRTLPEILVI